MKYAHIVAGTGLTLALACAGTIASAAATANDDALMVHTDGTSVSWFQSDESHEFFQSLGSAVTPAGFQAATVYLTGPAEKGETPLFGGYSDAFTITNSTTNPGHLDIYFLSDGATATEIANFVAISPPTALNTLKETGSFQDVSSYFKQANGFAQIQSDVPEPATWAMMLVGFGGLGVAMRSRRKSALAVA